MDVARVFHGLFGALALLWTAVAIDLARGVPTLPSLREVKPLEDGRLPRRVDPFRGARRSGKTSRRTRDFLALDYPHYEIVAVDDRSEDGTQKILENAARTNSHVKFVRVNSLPAGWLGKPHGLQQAYEHSSGEWLVFTDADVHFSPELLRRTVALAMERGWDHLTLFSRAETSTPGERIVLTFFALAILMAVRPWRVNSPQLRYYAGIGSFQLLRRSAYEAMGTHRRLAMEVVDDMKLGKLVKHGGFRSGLALAFDEVSLRWHAGVGNIIRGTTKNFFAAMGYKLWLASLQIVITLTTCVFPFVALPFLRGWALAFAGIAAGLLIAMEAGVCLQLDEPIIYALSVPIGAVIFAWMIARSTIVTLWNGGITWRGTFYPIEELKRGIV